MPSFRTQKHIGHSAERMFALVADIERYPEFLPMCEALIIKSRKEREGGSSVLVADMSVGYKMMRENFTTQVDLQPLSNRIDVQYLDGPFKYLKNSWQFFSVTEKEIISEKNNLSSSDYAENSARQGALSQTVNMKEETIPAVISDLNKQEACLVDFYIDYAFKNPILSAVMGAMFETAFRKFTRAFETRADEVYGSV